MVRDEQCRVGLGGSQSLLLYQFGADFSAAVDDW